MKIVIATGVYPPEVGGPSYYAKGLAESLRAQGVAAPVVTYGRLKKLPSGLRHLAYTLRLLPAVFRADAIIALDVFSVAVPAVVVGAILRTPVFVRVGGDFLWEAYTERTHELVALPHVYDLRGHWSRKERIVYALQRWVVRHSIVVFTSLWTRAIWGHAYELDPARTHVVENAVPPRLESIAPVRKNFLFYTRPLALKNREAFRRAFEKAKEVRPEIELEEGMVPQEELLKRMRAGYAVVLPSISDVTPNYITDAIRCGKPFLLTKHSGYAEPYKQYGEIIDPFSEEDMTRGILALADDVTYAAYAARIAAFTGFRSYDTIAGEFLALAQNVHRT